MNLQEVFDNTDRKPQEVVKAIHDDITALVVSYTNKDDTAGQICVALNLLNAAMAVISTLELNQSLDNIPKPDEAEDFINKNEAFVLGLCKSLYRKHAAAVADMALSSFLKSMFRT